MARREWGREARAKARPSQGLDLVPVLADAHFEGFFGAFAPPCQRPGMVAPGAPEGEAVDTSTASSPSSAPSRAAKARGWLTQHAWLVGAAACVLVLTRSVDFEPPEKVRLDEKGPTTLVGDAPAQSFADDLANPQAVQVRATLRRYADPSLDVSNPDPDVDARAQVMSQPVVTTIIGMSANIGQTVRLDGGELEVELEVVATPRVLIEGKKGKAPQLSLEHRIDVRSERELSFGRGTQRRTHVQSRGVLVGLEQGPHRVVFSVGEELFALDLELHHGA